MAEKSIHLAGQLGVGKCPLKEQIELSGHFSHAIAAERSFIPGLRKNLTRKSRRFFTTLGEVISGRFRIARQSILHGVIDVLVNSNQADQARPFADESSASCSQACTAIPGEQAVQVLFVQSLDLLGRVHRLIGDDVQAKNHFNEAVESLILQVFCSIAKLPPVRNFHILQESLPFIWKLMAEIALVNCS